MSEDKDDKLKDPNEHKPINPGKPDSPQPLDDETAPGIPVGGPPADPPLVDPGH